MTIQRLCDICHRRIGDPNAKRKLKIYCWGHDEEYELGDEIRKEATEL